MGAYLDLDDLTADWPLARAELAELRKDFARYRWLRANVVGTIHLLRGPGIGLSHATGEDFDAAIDAAMKEKP